MSKILIVEDEESIAELEKDYLELSGFEVEIENEGESGLKRALEEEFDLFILDLMLPGVDGFEICKKSVKVKIRRLSWFPQKRMILIKFGAWVWEQTTILRNPLARVKW